MEILAAIIGGAISGAVILAAVYLTDYVNKNRAIHDQLRADLQKATLLLPIVLVYLGPNPPNALRLSIGSPGWELDQQVTMLLMRLEVGVRHLRGRQANERAVDAISDINARYISAKIRFQRDGIVLSYPDMQNITMAATSEALLPPPNRLDDRIKRYVERGFSD